MFTKQAQSISIFVGIPEKCVSRKMWSIVPQRDVERTRNYKFVLTSTDLKALKEAEAKAG